MTANPNKIIYAAIAADTAKDYASAAGHIVSQAYDTPMPEIIISKPLMPKDMSNEDYDANTHLIEMGTSIIRRTDEIWLIIIGHDQDFNQQFQAEIKTAKFCNIPVKKFNLKHSYRPVTDIYNADLVPADIK